MVGGSVMGTIGFRSPIDVDRTAHHGTDTGSDQHAGLGGKRLKFNWYLSIYLMCMCEFLIPEYEAYTNLGTLARIHVNMSIMHDALALYA